MTFQTGSIDKNGLARTEDGKLYVTAVGNAAITSGSGVPVLIAASSVAVASPSDTNENTLVTVAVPAATLGAKGILRIKAWWTMTGNTNVKTPRIRFGGTALAASAISTAAVTGVEFDVHLENRNATNSQRFSANYALNSGTLASGFGTGAIDTTAAVNITFTMQKATGTDTGTLEGYVVEYLKPVA